MPFGCPNNQKVCGLKVQIFLPDSNSCKASDIALNYNTKQRSMRGCGVEILNTEVGQPMPLTLQGFMTGNVHRQGWHSMARLTTLKTVSSHPLFQGYFLDPIEVSIQRKILPYTAVFQTYFIVQRTCTICPAILIYEGKVRNAINQLLDSGGGGGGGAGSKKL